jgi:hypothetical protein
MNYLRVEKNHRRLWRAPLRNGEHCIGRDSACEIFLDHPAVSRRHAKLVCQNERVKIIDLASGNGTFLLGRKIQEKDLTPGEAIQIAEYFLILEERKQIENKFKQIIKSPFNILAVAFCAAAFAVYISSGRSEKPAIRDETMVKIVAPATVERKLQTAQKDSALQQAGLSQRKSAPPTVSATAERKRNAPKAAVRARQQKKKSPQPAASC